MIDALTESWIRNEADAKAAANGARFNEDRAAYVVWWIERYCRLYEGAYAGQPLILRGAFSQPADAILDDYWGNGDVGRKRSIERLHDYMDCFATGEQCGWQYECIARLFGWERYSKHWDGQPGVSNGMIRRFRRGAVWCPKKQGKSPTMAAVALYLLCGEGEPGQKVFLTAKDGEQIRQNVALHIYQMLDQSDELNAECKRNLNKMSVFHIPTASLLIPLSSGNERNQKAKEGLNGSVLVDEAHVVDREHMSRITRAGISRAEAMLLHFSTAGNDPDSYGKEEFDYGEENNRTGENESHFHAYYGAPQTLTDEDLAADPEKYIRLANPAAGHLIDVDEALADYRASCKTIAKLAEFKMYRLNVWQRSANPWLRADDWAKCRRNFQASDLRGCVCAAGLDLGKTDDMSALTLVFPEDADKWAAATAEVTQGNTVKTESGTGEQLQKLLPLFDQPVKVLTRYWIPDESLEKYDGPAPYKQWHADGWLHTTNTTSTNTVDCMAILESIRAMLREYQVKMLAYDPWYAKPIIDSLIQANDMPEDYVWPFQQTIQRYAWPSAMFERMVLSGNLHHDGNPITAWEAGHVQAKQDNNGNCRPVKPKREDHKKIDGIVSMIMALDAATRLSNTMSVYETRGPRWL